MYSKKKIMLVFGTRPEAIKMCPLVRELREREVFLCRVCVTGQHRRMLDRVMETFDVSADYDLAIMKEGQDLFDITLSVLDRIKAVLKLEKPDIVLVHGDTSSAFCAALACFYLGIPVGHVEAGLRTYDLSAPFPEEWNRRAIDILASYHFAPTERARKNLRGEGIASDKISVTGNTGIDALRTTVRKDYKHPILDWATGSRLILLTAHRRENIGEPMERAFASVRRIAEEFDDVKVVYPVHPNPAVREIADKAFGECQHIKLVSALDTIDFHNILSRCYLVLTDSGGIQEEAPALGKPVLVMRNSTERQEGIEAGVLRLIGTGSGSVYRGIRDLLENEALYFVMSHSPNPYGDGYASRRIADKIEEIIL